MKKVSVEKEEVRVIRVFDNVEDAVNEMRSNIRGANEDPDLQFSFTEEEVLFNIANIISNFMLLNEAGLMSKDDLDLYLGQKDYLVNAHPLEFNFMFRSSINNRFYTNRYYTLEKKEEEEAYSSILDCYSVLSIMYSFDRIIEKMREMVTEFKAAHEDFDKMTKDERLERFWSWQGNEDYIMNDFFVNLLDKCRKTYAVLYHEISRKNGGQ